MKVILLYSALSLPFNLFSQIKVQNLSLQYPDSTVLYIGIDNKMKITGIKDLSNTTVEIQGLKSEPESDGSLIIHVLVAGSFPLYVFNKSKLTYLTSYNVKEISRPKAILGVYRDSVLSVTNIVKNAKLNIYLPGCIAIFNSQVTGFEMSFISDNISHDIFYKVIGNSLSSSQLEVVKSLKSGDKIMFKKITFIGADDESSLTLNVTVK